MTTYINRLKRIRWISILLVSWGCFFQMGWAYSPYSNNELDQLEKEFVQLINQSDSIIRNPLANQYIQQLARKLAISAHQDLPDFFIVKSNEINAFAGPGGHIGLNTQLFLTTESESELAAVMAHEMAHVRQHHLYRMMEHQKQMRIPMLASMLASIALGVINPVLGSGALMASLSGAAQDGINFTRASEKEADRIGINTLIKSGLDPRGMAGFFKKMQQNMRYYYTGNVPAILRTHPLDEDRIAEAENRSAHLALKEYPQNLDFYLFREIIRTEVSNDKRQLIEYYQKQCPRNNKASVCQYGQTLALIKMNQFKIADDYIRPLVHEHPENFYYAIAMAQADLGQKHTQEAIKRLSDLHNNYPDNYATLVAYAQGLIQANQPEAAVNILLRGSRQYKYDLSICEQLAYAQAAASRKDYAYFTQAQCELLQGKRHSALNQLKLAQELVKNDALLRERIMAKIEEIKMMNQ